MRVGLNDDQIATQLDVSPVGVRFYVSEVIAKLGVASREAAASWRPPEEPTNREKLLALLRKPPRPRVTPMRVALAAIIGVIAALYAWGLFFYDDGEDVPAAAVLEVEWLPIDAPSFDAEEGARPYASSVPPGAEDVWRVYVAGGSGTPRLLLETHRRPGSTAFSQDGRTALTSFSSRSSSGEPLSGFFILNLGDGSTLQERLYPVSSAPRPSPDGARLVLTGTPRGTATRQIYVVDSQGASRQLVAAGLTYSSVGSWSPDGLRLIVGSYEPGETLSRFYVLTPGESAAFDLGLYRLPPVWSPDGSMVAGFDDNGLVIYDVQERSRRRVRLGRRVDDSTQGQLASGLSWSNDSKSLSAAGVVALAASGRVLHEHSRDTAFASVSPEGKWTVAASNFVACGGPARSTSRVYLPNETRAFEVGSGREVSLLGCDDRLFVGTQRWLSPETVLLAATTCMSPECSPSPPLALILASLPDGRLRFLTNEGGEQLAGYAVSPDGARVLVGGAALRLFAANGDLLRTIAAPEGTYVTGLSWAQDGLTYAYVVGPRTDGGAP
jgi:hypothetical protein